MRSTNFKRLALAVSLAFTLAGNAFSQDTLRVMTYNLLRYGAAGIGCTSTGVTTRNPYLLSIMGATLPDIFGVNEVGPFAGNTSPANNLLINVLQPINPAYRGTTMTFNNSQDIANCMYYNSDKVGLADESVIPEPTLTLRDINYYKFYYKGPGLALGDTTFIEIVQVHLHSSDENTRQVQTTDIMAFLDGLGRSGNFIVQGDLNLDGSTAGSFQNMVAHPNADCKLNDVLNLTGNWHSNGSALRAMTQATSSSPVNPCGSGGPLDDRFDHILVSNSLLNNTAGIVAIPASYWVPGNATSPNRSVTAAVLNGLKLNSDHFPVVLDFEVSRAVASATGRPTVAPLQLRRNPSQGVIEVAVVLQTLPSHSCQLRLLNLSGQLVKTWPLALGQAQQFLHLDASNIAAGAYFLQLQADEQVIANEKVLMTQL
jgi:endonuclease/exonuclease/phosphatase family metal-dependent hydrolase